MWELSFWPRTSWIQRSAVKVLAFIEGRISVQVIEIIPPLFPDIFQHVPNSYNGFPLPLLKCNFCLLDKNQYCILTMQKSLQKGNFIDLTIIYKKYFFPDKSSCCHVTGDIAQKFNSAVFSNCMRRQEFDISASLFPLGVKSIFTKMKVE